MLIDRFRLDGKVAIISGAGKGIGAGIALAFAEMGADIVIAARTEADLQKVAAKARAMGRRAVVVAGDLGTREAMATVVDRAVSELGGIDVVVNNVGGTRPVPFMNLTEEGFRFALEWNVITAFNLSQLAVPHLLERDGANIINIASAAGRFASRGFVAYSTAKAGMIQLTRTMAADLCPKIRVNVIAPGAIQTEALETVLGNEAIRNGLVNGTPMKRIGTLEDIALGAVYLASPAASYVTGKMLEIDGGLQSSNLPLPIPDL